MKTAYGRCMCSPPGQNAHHLTQRLWFALKASYNAPNYYLNRGSRPACSASSVPLFNELDEHELEYVSTHASWTGLDELQSSMGVCPCSRCCPPQRASGHRTH